MVYPIKQSGANITFFHKSGPNQKQSRNWLASILLRLTPVGYLILIGWFCYLCLLWLDTSKKWLINEQGRSHVRSLKIRFIKNNSNEQNREKILNNKGKINLRVFFTEDHKNLALNARYSIVLRYLGHRKSTNYDVTDDSWVTVHQTCCCYVSGARSWGREGGKRT